ncbi:MAG: amidase, partial [Aquincola tertiaricarbonis]
PPGLLLRQADERDAQLASGQALGWMHGMPQAPKDLAHTVGIRNTAGSPLLKDFMPTADAIVVEPARRSGALFIGKTNTPEFGLGSHTYNTVFGTTLNAYDSRRSAGGSSGGAAVALALRLLPVADGSDMMGSLRNPAGWNNVYGFRPSFGRVPAGPAGEVFMQQLGIEGPMGRSVADVAMLLSTQAGFDRRAPLSIDQDPARFAGPLQRDFKGTRIGWLGDFNGYLPMEPGVMELSTRALQSFRDIGCQVEAALPDYPMERLWQTWLTLRGFLMAGLLGGLHADPAKRALLKPEAVWEIENGLMLSGSQVWTASRARTDWYLALARLFERFDYLVLPSAQVFPFDATEHWPKAIAGKPMDTYHRWMEVVVPGTLAGLPVMNVPAGFATEGPHRGLPMGLQVMGRPQADASVLQLAHAHEQATRWVATQRPPLLGRVAQPL